MTDEMLVGERAVLEDYLGHYRRALALKCAGLDAEQLARRSVPPSTMSLLGLVRHLARVEHSGFRRVMGHDLTQTRLYWTEEDPDLDFNEAVADPGVVEDAWATWRASVAYVDELIATQSLDTEGVHDSGPLQLREAVVHLIEEYARHLGHADLRRECIDGRTGH